MGLDHRIRRKRYIRSLSTASPKSAPADGGSVFKMATFAESGTEYAKVTKPVVEYK